jgi:hypothetical protein
MHARKGYLAVAARAVGGATVEGHRGTWTVRRAQASCLREIRIQYLNKPETSENAYIVAYGNNNNSNNNNNEETDAQRTLLGLLVHVG